LEFNVLFQHKYGYIRDEGWAVIAELKPAYNVHQPFCNLDKCQQIRFSTRMWRSLFSTAKFGWRRVLECLAVTLPRRETRWNLQECPKLPNRSQPLVG